jgi:hypothetical protein
MKGAPRCGIGIKDPGIKDPGIKDPGIKDPGTHPDLGITTRRIAANSRSAATVALGGAAPAPAAATSGSPCCRHSSMAQPTGTN